MGKPDPFRQRAFWIESDPVNVKKKAPENRDREKGSKKGKTS